MYVISFLYLKYREVRFFFFIRKIKLSILCVSDYVNVCSSFFFLLYIAIDIVFFIL